MRSKEMRWHYAIREALEKCGVYENAIPRMIIHIMGFAQIMGGLSRDAIHRGLRFAGVDHDDIEFMASAILAEAR